MRRGRNSGRLFCLICARACVERERRKIDQDGMVGEDVLSGVPLLIYVI